MNGPIVNLHFVFIWTFPAGSWIQRLLCALWPECVRVYAWTLTLFFHLRVFKRIAPHLHMFLPWTSIAETCKTWQQMASSTMRDSTEHCQFVLPKKEEKKNSSSLPEVKWIDFKVSWAVRKLWNCLCRSIAELYNGAKVKQRSPHS